MTLEEISREALQLEEGEQVELAYRLMDHVRSVPSDGFQTEEVRREWLHEVTKRTAALRAGTSVPSPLSDVMSRLRSKKA